MSFERRRCFFASERARFGAGGTICNHADDLLLEVREYTSRRVERSHSARNATMLGERGMQGFKVILYFFQWPRRSQLAINCALGSVC